MHLLSAILQEATGMTAAEFARANLFEPLGIQDFFWEADPQGYTDGWAGLYLHPHDVARLGYLWLNNGQWEGRQIVSSRWVAESTRVQKKTGMGDNYGLGWWIPSGELREYAAEGRAGQYLRVFPDLNLIVVTTGGGFEWNEIVPLLATALVDQENTLPANPAGVGRLEAALASIAAPPDPQPVPPLPETARRISGQTFSFDTNPLSIETVRLSFNGTAEADLQVTLAGQPAVQFKVGLDGVFRLSPQGEYGLPQGMRGRWLDAETFLLEYERIASIDSFNLQLRFAGDQVTLDAQQRTYDAGIQAQGRLGAP
jgi:hypothetical protein